MYGITSIFDKPMYLPGNLILGYSAKVKNSNKRLINISKFSKFLRNAEKFKININNNNNKFYIRKFKENDNVKELKTRKNIVKEDWYISGLSQTSQI